MVRRMKTKDVIKEMRKYLREDMIRLKNKGYKNTDTYIRAESKEHILDWVLDGEE